MSIHNHRITWIELPATDIDRAERFYAKVLDQELMNYSLEGAPIEMRVFPAEEGTISGAIVQGEGYVPSQDGAVVYINTGEDLQPAIDRVEAAGGTILQPKKLINEHIGYDAHFIDSEGNRVALHSRK